METEKRVRRLEMQNKLLSQKLYQVCASHDHLSTVLQRSGVQMSNMDSVMMEATKRIVTAKTLEEIETIYSESAGKLFKGGSVPIVEKKPKKSGISEVFFFPTNADPKDIISQIEKMLNDVEKHIQNMEDEGKDLFGSDPFNLDSDHLDEDEGNMSPPF